MSTIKFERDFSLYDKTRGTKKFKEILEPGEPPGLGIIYIKNELWEELGKPESFTMTIDTD